MSGGNPRAAAAPLGADIRLRLCVGADAIILRSCSESSSLTSDRPRVARKSGLFPSPAMPAAGCAPRGTGRDCENIEAFHLPSYSLELNPDELLNASLQHSITTAAAVSTAKAVPRTAVGGLRNIQKQPT